MGWAGYGFNSPRQEVTNDMKITDPNDERMTSGYLELQSDLLKWTPVINGHLP